MKTELICSCQYIRRLVFLRECNENGLRPYLRTVLWNILKRVPSSEQQIVLACTSNVVVDSNSWYRGAGRQRELFALHSKGSCCKIKSNRRSHTFQNSRLQCLPRATEKFPRCSWLSPFMPVAAFGAQSVAPSDDSLLSTCATCTSRKDIGWLWFVLLLLLCH